MPRPTAVYLGWAGSLVSDELERLISDRYELLDTFPCAFGQAVDQDDIVPSGVDYLFSFGPLILRRSLLDRVRCAAVNFHTGPPRWPGRGSVSFALLNGDAEFGVTAHVIVEEIDQGPIIQVLRFPIDREDSVATLAARAQEAIPALARAVLDDLAKTGGQPRPTEERWERTALTQADLLAQMRIGDDDDSATVARKIRAFAHPTKPGPFIERAGHRFWYSADEAELR